MLQQYPASNVAVRTITITTKVAYYHSTVAYLLIHGVEEAGWRMFPLGNLPPVVPCIENLRAQAEPVLQCHATRNKTMEHNGAVLAAGGEEASYVKVSKVIRQPTLQ